MTSSPSAFFVKLPECFIIWMKQTELSSSQYPISVSKDLIWRLIVDMVESFLENESTWNEQRKRSITCYFGLMFELSHIKFLWEQKQIGIAINCNNYLDLFVILITQYGLVHNISMIHTIHISIHVT